MRTAKAMARRSGRTFEAIRLPAMAPATAAAVNVISRVSPMLAWVPSRDSSAEAELMAITSRDVPTAVGMSKPRASTSAGTTTKPPPTPKNPVTSPTIVAAITTRTGDTDGAAFAREAGRGGGGWGRGGGSRRRVAPRAPAAVITVVIVVAEVTGRADGRRRPGRGRRLRRRDGTGPLTAQHRDRRARHEHGERGEQGVGVDAGRQAAAGEGAARAEDAEHDPGAHPNPPGTQMDGHAHERGDADDDQRRGRRAVRALAQQLDQRGHGQDRPAPAERAEAQADQDPDGQRDQHNSPP